MRATARLSLPVLLAALVALSVSGAIGTTGATLRQVSGDSPVRPAALRSYHALPLAFVPNAGQLDRRVRYSAQAGGSRLYLTRNAVTLALAKGGRGLALRLAFLRTNPTPAISGARLSPGRVNYLIGNDPLRWRRNLPTYAEVVYHELWPGIHLAVRGRGGQLKYEFLLAPGADPDRIRLRYRGQQRLSVGREGALRVETAFGSLRDARPLSYQPIGGRRVAVASRFALGEGGAYGFALGDYDRRRQLVIDPGLLYSTFFGGRSEVVRGIAVDRAGSVYVTGQTISRNFPATPGAFDRSYNGKKGWDYTTSGDAFVTKLNAAGSALAYSTYLGGRRADIGTGIAVDRAGRAYVTGDTNSTNFPTTRGALDGRYPGGTGHDAAEGFVTKLNAAGSALVYSTFLGGRRADEVSGIAVDRAGSAYITGITLSKDFPTTRSAFDRHLYFSTADAFVTKLDTAGSLAYSTFLGGSGGDAGYGIAVDRTGSAYVTGWTSGGFPTTRGALDRRYNGGESGDAFVTKLNATGSALGYSTYFDGTISDEGNPIAVDGVGRAVLTGFTDSPRFPTTRGAFDRSYNGTSDAFVTKLNAAGSALAYSTFLGGREGDGGSGIAADRAGSIYVTGGTYSADFPTTAGAFDTSENGGKDDYHDAFVVKLNPVGSTLAYSTYLGGRGTDLGAAIVVDRAGNAYVTGHTGSRNFPTTSRAFDRSYNGGGAFNTLGSGGDAFVTKLKPVGPPLVGSQSAGRNSSSPPARNRGSGFSIGLWETVGALLVVAAVASLMALSYRHWFRVHRIAARR